MKVIKYDTKVIKTLVDIDDKTIVDDFMDEYFYYDEDWEDDDEILLSDDWDGFWEQYEEVTDEDKKRISKLVNEEIQYRISQNKKEQEDVLKDRASIINFFDDIFYSDKPDEISSLSYEEIIDLIIKNGNK
jgi:hypothetical protein